MKNDNRKCRKNCKTRKPSAQNFRNTSDGATGLYNNQFYVKLPTIKLITLLNDTLKGTQQGRKFMMHFLN